MIQRLEELRQNALRELDAIKDLPNLEQWRVRYLGRKSDLTGMLRGLAELPIEERKSAGAMANRLKDELSPPSKTRALRLKQKHSRRRCVPVKRKPHGLILPCRAARTRWAGCTRSPRPSTRCAISSYRMGFQIVEGPDVEWDYYNFEALNIPPSTPPATPCPPPGLTMSERGERSMLLRTHTTGVTARVIEKMKPPIRVVEPGKVYRYEASDATHTPMFHQIDGLAVDKGITMADLKGALYEFARRFFGEDRKVRFRCDYFPFVEPGVEMAIECAVCHGGGCRLCGNSGWIEIAGRRHDAPAGAASAAALTRRSTPASPSASASTACPCCATASMTSGCSTAMTCDS